MLVLNDFFSSYFKPLQAQQKRMTPDELDLSWTKKPSLVGLGSDYGVVNLREALS